MAVSIAYPFVLGELRESLSPNRLRVRAMFGSHALYVDEKIVFILRQKRNPATVRDNGVWVALADPAHAGSLSKDFPALREIEMFKTRGGKGFGGWLNLPEDGEGFEEAAMSLCRLVLKGDSRIGKVPKPRRKQTVRRTGASTRP